jgi:hypothetical protein
MQLLLTQCGMEGRQREDMHNGAALAGKTFSCAAG